MRGKGHRPIRDRRRCRRGLWQSSVSPRGFALRQNHGHRVALEGRHLLDADQVLQFVQDLVENLSADVGVRELPASEADRDLDLLPFFEETLNGLRLEIEVVVVGLGTESDLFEKDDLLVLASLALFLLLVVLEATVVQKPAHRGNGGRRNFYEIETTLSRDGQRIGGVENSELLSVFSYETDLGNPDPFVYP